MHKTAFGVLAALMFASSPSHAQNCANPQAQAEMNICSFQAYQTADADLNKVYKQARTRLSQAGKISLRDAQRAWITFRDKDCEAAASQFEGGSIAPLIVNSCLERLTKERTAGLRLLLESY